MHNALIQALAKVDRPGDFCTAGNMPLTMPGLEVEGLGLVRLPLAERQAVALIKCCQQAPYGRGSQTLVDTRVRRVWELDAKYLRFTNPKWQTLIDSIVEQVQLQLGLADQKLTANLYKLLVYEQGSFFLPHRDSEKHDGMVATLAVVLPSVHEGGELIVSHQSKQHKFKFAGAAIGHELSYAAFYADCEHEVRPLKSGYRLCLTYNVALVKSRGSKRITAPTHDAAVRDIAAIFNAWKPGAGVQKLAVTLDYRYTRQGFTTTSLKGVDRSRAEVLFEAAERAGCVAHLALVTLWQNGSADYDHEMDEIFDTTLLADCWFDRQGRTIHYGEIPLLDSELVSDSPLSAGDPTEEEFEGYTGNAGMTLERWYHRAVIVIWPRAAHFAVLCGAGTDAAIAGLHTMVKRLKRSSNSRQESLSLECRDFAATVIDSWQIGGVELHRPRSPASNRDTFCVHLLELGDHHLIRRFLIEVVAADGGIRLGAAFAKFCNQQGWSLFEVELLSVIKASTADSLVRNAELVDLICRQRGEKTERVALGQHLCASLVTALQVLDEQPAKPTWQTPKIDRVSLLACAVSAMLAVEAQSSLTLLIEHALRERRLYKLTATHLATVFKLEPQLNKLTKPNKALDHWFAVCRQALEARTATPPVKPEDYRRTSKLPCKCEDCRQLSLFLADPIQHKAQIPLNKQRRQHIHQIIDDNAIDLTHVTERRGRPYTLVCIKTNASFQLACKIHSRDVDNLSRLVKVTQRIGKGAGVNGENGKK